MSWRMSCVAFVTAVVLTTVITSLAGEPKGKAKPAEMKQFFVALLHKGPSWTAQVTEEVQNVQKAHMENIRRHVASGKLVLAGPFSDDGDLRGLFFFNTESMEEAQQLAEMDPAVKAGRLRIELHPWWGPAKLEKLLAEESVDTE